MCSRHGRVLVVLVASLALASGCNVPLGGDAPARPAETLTPAPVTDVERTTMEGRLPPGVNANGTVNVSRLLDAHNASLEGRSYTWGYRRNESTRRSASRAFARRVRVSDGAILVEDTNVGFLDRRSVYLRGDRGSVRNVIGNETEFARVTSRDDHDYAPGGELLRVVLPRRGLQVAAVERNGQRFYRLHASLEQGPKTFGRAARDRSLVSDYRVTVYVTPAGRLRTVSVEYDEVGVSKGTHHVSIRFDYTAVGETTVTKPDWVAAANRTLTPTGTPSPPSTAASPSGSSGTPTGRTPPSTATG